MLFKPDSPLSRQWFEAVVTNPIPLSLISLTNAMGALKTNISFVRGLSGSQGVSRLPTTRSDSWNSSMQGARNPEKSYFFFFLAAFKKGLSHIISPRNDTFDSALLFNMLPISPCCSSILSGKTSPHLHGFPGAKYSEAQLLQSGHSPQ